MATAWVQEGYDNIQPIGQYQIMWGEDPPPVPAGISATWEQIADWAYLTSCAAGGGSQTPTATVAGTANTHTLTAAQIASHTHNIVASPYGNQQGCGCAASARADFYTEYTGGGQPHENRPLSYVVTIWVRTA